MKGWFNIKKWQMVICHSNRVKKKDHVIIPISVEKAFGKNPTFLFLIKILNKLGTEGNLFNLTKSKYFF